jgi:hypothetical protein
MESSRINKRTFLSLKVLQDKRLDILMLDETNLAKGIIFQNTDLLKLRPQINLVDGLAYQKFFRNIISYGHTNKTYPGP